MCLGDALDDGQAEADACVVGAMRSVPRWNGSASVETSCGVSFSPVFSTVSTTVSGCALVVTRTVPLFGEVVDDRVVQEVRGHLQQERG